MVNWKDSFNSSKPLISYAMLAGIPTKTILEGLSLISQGAGVPDTKLQLEMIDRIPRADRKHFELPPGITSYTGEFNISTEFVAPVTNPLVLTRTNGDRVYGVALIFYEDLKDYIRIVQSSKVVSAMMKQEDEEGLRISTLVSHSDPDSFIEDSQKGRASVNLEKYLNNFTEEDLLNDKIFNSHNYFVPKALILLSELPIFEEMEQILKYLVADWFSGIDFPLESYLSYLTHFAPLPQIGSEVTYSFPNEVEFKIKSNALNELPFCWENYVFNFFYNRIMSIGNFHELLYWFLCQTGKPVFISSDITKIIATVETLKAVIFPFEYDQQYIPNLPDSLNEFLGTEFIYPLGKIREEKDSLEDIYEEASELTLFVLLDKDQLMVRLGGEEVYLEQYKASYQEIEEKKVEFSLKVLPKPEK